MCRIGDPSHCSANLSSVHPVRATSEDATGTDEVLDPSAPFVAIRTRRSRPRAIDVVVPALCVAGAVLVVTSVGLAIRKFDHQTNQTGSSLF